MRSLFLFIAATLACFPALAQNSAPPAPPSRTISVSGEGEVRVVPDQALISMTAENRGADIGQAKAANDRTVKALLEYITGELGVPAKNVQTDFVSIEPVYKQCHYEAEMTGKCDPLETAWYSVRKGVQVRLDELGKYERLVARALELGVTRVDDIQFITKELRKHRDEARDLAARASQEKARAIAETLGMQLGKPLTINTENYYNYYWNGSAQRGHSSMMMQNVIQNAPGGTAPPDGSTLALGQINISARVQVTYEME